MTPAAQHGKPGTTPISCDRGCGRQERKAMTVTTKYVLQSFVAGEGGKLIGEPAVEFSSAEQAVAEAERIAPEKAGVFVFRPTHETETGLYHPGAILFQAGRLPDLE